MSRPKILLASTYEEASEQIALFKDYLLGVVSDIEFPQNGELNPAAGFELAREVRSMVPDVPIVLQSSRTEFKARAHAEGFSFLRKRSPTLLRDLRRFMTEQFAFGDFVFRLPDNTEVARAADLDALEATRRATTSRAGSRPAPSSRSRRSCARARSRTSPVSSSCGTT